VLVSVGAASFPNLQPFDLPPAYGKPGFEFSGIPDCGELKFVDHYPAQDSLTRIEKYMVSGGHTDTKGFPAWESTIYRTAGFYYMKFGKLPDVVTPEVYRAAYGLGPDETSDELSVLANPLTGEWARLNQTLHSPGDFYMKVLSQAEKEYIVQFRPGFRGDWLENQVNGKPIDVIIPPIYYRMYGVSGVISNKLLITFKEQP
jgi:hypothetical protein